MMRAETAADPDHSRRLGLTPRPSKATPSRPRASPTTTGCCASIRTRWSTPPGPFVGLPDGQMGNSEVGHLNIGAGRVIHMDVTRIDLMIASGDFFRDPTLLAAMHHARTPAACT